MTGRAGPVARAAAFDLDDDRVARAAWSRVAEPGDAEAWRLVARLGAGPALRQALDGGGRPRWLVRVPELDPIADLTALERSGGELLVPGDAGWPEGLAALGERQPFCLWVRGAVPLAPALARSVALVGARAATPYGERVARELATGCAARGLAVVSGAAYGIDGAAHRAVLAGEGITVGVLACGVDRAYPRGHERLIEAIADRGALVSEVPPGSAPTRWRFLERNRLIAALAAGTVVVEAAGRSGARVSADRALEIGRPVGAVPGPVTSPMSYGCHQLLRDGAVCVTSAEEVIELVGALGADLAEPLPVQAAAHDGLSAVDLRVFDALPLRASVPVASICRTAGLDRGPVTAALGRLELGRLAQHDAGGWRRAPGPTGSGG